MRIIALACLLIGSGWILPAQTGAWHGLALFRLPTQAGQSFTLLVEREVYRVIEATRGDILMARLLAGGVRLQSASPDSLKALAAEVGKGTPGAGWVLLGPGQKALAAGTGQPSSREIESVLRSNLGTLPWDAIEAVLKAQPDHGEARLAMAEWTLALLAPPSAQESSQMWSWGWFRPERFQTDAVDALNALIAIPGWPSQVDFNGADPGQLGPRLRQLAPKFLPLIKRMAFEVLAAVARDPENPFLQSNLALLLLIADRETADRLVVEIEQVLPLPGQDWPPLPVIHAMPDLLGKPERWRELQLRMEAWSRPPDKLYLSEEYWRRRILREATLLTYASLARNRQEGWEILPGLLADLRKASGGSYGSLANVLLRRAKLPQDPDIRKELHRLAALPPLPPPPRPPGLPPWSLRIHETAGLTRIREAFDSDQSLCRWLPLEREFAVKKDPGWEVGLGADPVAGGQGRIGPGLVSDLMAQGRAGRLLQAWERVGQEPEADGPRSLRVALLLERGHVKGLESFLAEDLRLVLKAADIQDWPLDENLWYAEAQRCVPALEEHLRRWPLDEARWGALAFWSGFLPRHQGPAQLAVELPSWRTEEAFLLCLPVSVHDRVGKVLRARGAWTASRAWFEAAWNALGRLRRNDARRTQLERGLGPLVHAHLEESYRQLGMAGPQRALGEAWQDMRQHFEVIPK